MRWRYVRNLPLEELRKRRERLQQWLPPRSTVIIWSGTELPASADMRYPFVGNPSFVYLTGLHEPDMIYLYTPDHPEKEWEEVLIRFRKPESHAIWEGEELSEKVCREISGISHIETIASEQEWWSILGKLAWHSTFLYLESGEHERKSPSLWADPLRAFCLHIQRMFPNHQYRRLEPVLTQLRMEKSEWEIAQIEEANRIAGETFRDDLLSQRFHLKNEAQVEGILVGGLRRRGARESFPVIVAGGPRSCILHYMENRYSLDTEPAVLIDWGAWWNFYCSDLTRVVPLAKNAKAGRWLDVYQAVWEVHQALLEFIVAGRTWYEIQEFAFQQIARALVSLKILSSPDTRKAREYFMHGFGHHLGMDVHDPAFRDDPLRVGAVLTCEPGIYWREKGIGVRIETNLIVEERGTRQLDSGVPADPSWFKSLME